MHASSSETYTMEPVHLSGRTLLKGRVSTQEIFHLSNSDLVPGLSHGNVAVCYISWVCDESILSGAYKPSSMLPWHHKISQHRTMTQLCLVFSLSVKLSLIDQDISNTIIQ
ncbi:hypothetical protein CsSME_00034134 [Camellia sinensis var. sinensis]